MQRYKLDWNKYDPLTMRYDGAIISLDTEGEWVKYEDHLNELSNYDEIVKFYIIMKDEEDVQERYKKKVEGLLGEAKQSDEQFLKEWRDDHAKI